MRTMMMFDSYGGDYFDERMDLMQRHLFDDFSWCMWWHTIHALLNGSWWR